VERVFTEVPNYFYENPEKSRCLLISVENFYFERRLINEDFTKKRSQIGSWTPPTTKRPRSKIELLITVRNVHLRDFDFLGFHFNPEGLSVAEKTIEKFLSNEEILKPSALVLFFFSYSISLKFGEAQTS